jgi:hypothetical protein
MDTAYIVSKKIRINVDKDIWQIWKQCGCM